MNVDLLAQPDLQVSLDVLALRDLRAQPERKVDRVRKDLKAQQEEMVFRAPLVCLDLEDLLDLPERMETRGRLENPARKEAKATKESMVHLVLPALKVLLELLVQPAQMESLVPEVSRVCLVRRETKDREDSPDLRAQSVCRAYPVHLVRKAKPETSVRWVLLVLLVPEVLLVPLEPTALRDLLVVLETLEQLARRVMLANQENLVFREKSAHQDREESEERRERPVRLVLQDLPALKAPLEMTVPKAVQVPAVSPVTPVPLESPVLLD